jgi:hypothetical protein
MDYQLRNKEYYTDFAAQNYTCSAYKTQKEFITDLNRVVYLKKLLNRLISGEDVELILIINHLIILFNVFKQEAILAILFFKIEQDNWKLLNTFLHFLKIENGNVPFIKINTNEIGFIEPILDQLKNASRR